MEYNNLPKFRTAVGGFNRMDVVSYIESLSLQNQQTLKKLQEENSDLRRQIAQYEAASAPSELEEAAADEQRDVKEIVSRIVPTYHIRPEDKERDEEAYQELLSLGRASHEKPVVEDK